MGLHLKHHATVSTTPLSKVIVHRDVSNGLCFEGDMARPLLSTQEFSENVPAFILVWGYGAKQTAPLTCRAKVILHDLVCRVEQSQKSKDNGYQNWKVDGRNDNYLSHHTEKCPLKEWFRFLLSPSPKQDLKRKGEWGLVYFACILIFVFKRLLRDSTQWPQNPR